LQGEPRAETVISSAAHESGAAEEFSKSAVRTLRYRGDREQGAERGRQRWRCLACGRTFGETLGTPLYRLKTDPAEFVRALRIVLHRGSLRAAEEQTGDNYETVAAWLERFGDHAEEITDLLVRNLHLSEVELDELCLG
jgi:transposase-like protein